MSDLPSPTTSPPRQRRSGKLTCRYCGGHSLRRSRLRRIDYPLLLLGLWPVRCRSCSTRQYMSFLQASRLDSSHVHTTKIAADQAWHDFTADTTEPNGAGHEHAPGDRRRD